MNRSTCIAFAALIAAGLSWGADAAALNSVRVNRVQVQYGDLDLSSLQGSKTLRARIESAAARACGGNPVFATHYREAPRFEQAAFNECRANAIHDAYAQLEAGRMAAGN